MNSFIEYTFPTKIQKIIDPVTFSEFKVIPPQSSHNLLVSIDSKITDNLENVCTNITSLKLASELNQKDSCSVDFIFKNSKNNKNVSLPCNGPYMQSAGQRIQAAHGYCLQVKELKQLEELETNPTNKEAYTLQIQQFEIINKQTLGIKWPPVPP